MKSILKSVELKNDFRSLLNFVKKGTIGKIKEVDNCNYVGIAWIFNGQFFWEEEILNNKTNLFNFIKK